jgi:hypothetical protein
VLRIPTAGTAQVLRLRRLSSSGANGNADGTVTVKAIAIEAAHFAKAAVTPQANALVGLFLADQAVKKAAKKS